MRALICKEVRELAPGFWLLLGASWAIGVVDVVYNWRQEREVGVSLAFWLLVSMVGALMAGANAFARESTRQWSFLNTWPTTPARIWLAKTIVPALMWAGLTALALGGCAGLLMLRGYEPMAALRGVTGIEAGDLWLLGSLWALLFSGGLLASAMAPSSMAAALLTPLALAPLMWGYVRLYFSLPAWFGPRLGLMPAEVSTPYTHVPVALIFSALCIAASAVAICRGTPGSWTRRARIGGVSLVTASVMTALLGLVVTWYALRPGPLEVANGSVEGSGQWIVITSEDQSLWAMDVEGKRLRPIVRGPVAWPYDVIEDSPRVALEWGGGEGGSVWLSDPETGVLWRLPEDTWAISPTGRHCLTANEDAGDVTVRPIGGERGRRVRLHVGGMMQVLGWGPDEATIHLSRRVGNGGSGYYDVPVELVRLRPFDGPELTVIARYDGQWDLLWPSPRSEWISAARTAEDEPDPRRYALVDLSSGEMIEFDGLFPSHRGWTPGDRYVWLRPTARDERDRFLEVFDIERREIVRRITPEDLEGLLPSNPVASPHSDDVLVFSYRRTGPKITDRVWWLAGADGANLRRTDIEFGDRVWGWTHDGDLVIWTEAGVERLDPDTMQRRVIRDLPRPPREDEVH